MTSNRLPENADSAAEPLMALEGVVERVVFAAPEDHYAVLRFRARGRRQPVTLVGALAGVQEGEELQVRGRFEHHPRFGEQFRAVWWYAVLPATVAGIERYLSSGLIKGVGPETARRLVEHFGAQTLEIIDRHPERLREVKGLGPKRLEQIVRDWQEHQGARKSLVALQGLGLGMALATKIYQHYGDQAVEVATTNPYQLVLEVSGIGFATADRLARRLNLDPLAPARLAAGLLHVLEEAAGDGHVFLPRERLLKEAAQLLEVPEDALVPALAALEREGRLVREAHPGGEAVYRKPAFLAEVGVARALANLRLSPGKPAPLHLPEMLEEVQRERGLTLSPEQAQAVMAACREKVLVLTGGPGTGKTTIVSLILDLYRRWGAKVLLMAPTGRAAKRLSETTGAEAATIHRALEFSPQSGGFRRHAGEPLKADVVIVDEVSMVDIYLMYHLLRAVPPEARLILVGDAHQLPAVGPGNVLKDLLDAGVVPVARLTQIYRQARESLIVVNAHRVNQGAYPVLPRRFGEGDFVFQEVDDPEEAHRHLLELVCEVLPHRYGFDPVKDIQIITPMHRGALGVAALNHDLQERLNPHSPVYPFGERAFRRLDKVMQLKNNYVKEVFNGDVGQVWDYEKETGRLLVDFDGRLVPYEPGEREELTLAYAVTVHKAQGSEFPAVVLVLTTQHYMLLQRNLLYTALTRGRRLLVLLGSKKALGMAIANDRPVRRFTRLAEKLRQAAGVGLKPAGAGAG